MCYNGLFITLVKHFYFKIVYLDIVISLPNLLASNQIEIMIILRSGTLISDTSKVSISKIRWKLFI